LYKIKFTIGSSVEITLELSIYLARVHYNLYFSYSSFAEFLQNMQSVLQVEWAIHSRDSKSENCS